MKIIIKTTIGHWYGKRQREYSQYDTIYENHHQNYYWALLRGVPVINHMIMDL